ncbi:uncharacterized protein ACNLHF_008222 isoform 2-T2 [Anomaloglossus baeobatrachus]|uniref:uncharacterized protein LOC142291703 isoform X2 n=1 Tax=Anomaloglossus baeobatrachus TaxID=238106 RepID=UPI003F505E00
MVIYFFAFQCNRSFFEIKSQIFHAMGIVAAENALLHAFTVVVTITTIPGPLEKIFGKGTMEYVLNLCRGQFDFIVRIPNSLKIRILSFLDTEDIKQLSETCKDFQQLCSSEEFWEKMKPKTEMSFNAVNRKISPVSIKAGKHSEKVQGPVWMRRRRNTLF